MKFRKKMLTLAAIGTALLAVGCSKTQTKESSSKIPTKITKNTTVTFWYSLTGSSEKALKKMTAEFEKENPKIKIKLESQGGNYADLQSKLSSTIQSPDNLPTITQAYPGWLYNAAKQKMLVDLTPYVKNDDLGWGSYAKSNIKQALWNGAKINNTQYGVPFNKSVEVLFYNKTLLDQYNLKVPQTMGELKSASEKIYQKSDHQVTGAGFDALNNYYMLGMKEKGINFTKKINFSGKDSKEVIDYYADGVRKGYFMQAGTEKYMSTPFNSGKVAMFIGSTANEAYLKQGLKKEYQFGIAPRPSKVNAQQGTDIYMFNQASARQKSAAFKYLKFLTSKKEQFYWTKTTGYMPVNTQVLNSQAYKSLNTSKVPAILAETTKDLYFLPVTKNATPAYDQVQASMQAILADAKKKKNINPAIQTAKQKFDASWKQ